MADNRALAVSIVEDMGGKDNINNVYHCMTRLRFELVDDDRAHLEQVRGLKGVLGIHVEGREIQVVIGPAVNEVYKETLAVTGLSETAGITENLDPGLVGEGSGRSLKDAIKNVPMGVLNAFSACMNPLVPIFVLMGMFSVVATLIGPSFLNLVAEDSDLYLNFYWTYQTVIYFLPVLLAVTASRHFKTNVFLSVVLACVLLYPDLVTLMADGTSQYSVYGIPATSVTYSSSVVPILLIVWAQSYVERVVQKLVPDMLKVVLEPLIVVLVMLPLSLCALGPVGNLVGVALGDFLVWLREVAGPVEAVVVGALGPFITAFGIGRPLFFVAMNTLFAAGSEAAYMPFALALTNFTSMGVALGFALKSRAHEKRELGLTCFFSNLLGGVSEPTLFGILLPNRKTWLPAIIGGAVGGAWMGITNVVAYQFGPSNILSVLCFVGGDGSGNLVNGIVGCALSFVVTLVATAVLSKRGVDDEEKAGSQVGDGMAAA